MEDRSDRRNWPRKLFVEPIQGIVYGTSLFNQSEPPPDFEKDTGQPFSFLYIFVSVHNLSPMGALIVSSHEFDSNSFWEFMVYDSSERRWNSSNACVAWTKKNADQDEYMIGLEFLPDQQDGDLNFLMNSELLECVPQNDIFLLLDCLSRRTIEAGETFISKGETGETMFLIQAGICSVKREMDAEPVQVARLRRGDMVGEMAILTDELRNADVDAETDLILWELSRNAFEKVSAKHPDLRVFLTEVLASRFESTLVHSDRTIGKYIIKRRIGKGGWSLVYHGNHKLLKRPAAIKMLRHDIALEPMFLKAFRKEADIIASMNNKNIIRIYDILEKYQTIFIIMELIEGRSLESLLKQVRTIEFPRAVDFLLQISSGLNYSHKKGIIHRDIKPANIYIQPDDQIKILDFGLACAPEAENIKFKANPAYAPPEQIKGTSVDARSDIYSVGVMAYEMVTGRRPYPVEDLAASMDMRCEQEIPDPSALAPGLPEGLRKFILKASRINPGERYQNVRSAQEDLLVLSPNKDFADDGLIQEKHKMTTLLLLYKEKNDRGCIKVLEEFSHKVRKLGVYYKAVEIKDI